MNPDQTAPNDQSALGPYCLQYRLPNYLSSECRLAKKVLLSCIGY